MSCGLYYKNITILNDDSIMMLQVVASPMIVNLTTLVVSFMLLANIYSRGVTHDDRHVTIVIYLKYRPLVFLHLANLSRGLYPKTFYGRTQQIFVIS